MFRTKHTASRNMKVLILKLDENDELRYFDKVFLIVFFFAKKPK